MAAIMMRKIADEAIPEHLCNLGIAMGVYVSRDDHYTRLRMINGHYHGFCLHWKASGFECSLPDEPLQYSKSGDLSWRAGWSDDTWQRMVEWTMDLEQKEITI